MNLDVSSKYFIYLYCLFQNWNFVRFHKFDQSAVWIFYISEGAGCFAHVEAAAGIHGKWVTERSTVLFEFFDAGNIKAEVDKAQIAPVAIFINMAWRVGRI